MAGVLQALNAVDHLRLNIADLGRDKAAALTMGRQSQREALGPLPLVTLGRIGERQRRVAALVRQHPPHRGEHPVVVVVRVKFGNYLRASRGSTARLR